MRAGMIEIYVVLAGRDSIVSIDYENYHPGEERSYNSPGEAPSYDASVYAIREDLPNNAPQGPIHSCPGWLSDWICEEYRDTIDEKIEENERENDYYRAAE